MGDTFVAFLHPNEVGHNFTKSLTDLFLYDRGRHIAQSGDSRGAVGQLDHGRNEITRAFLASECEWLFMVDADMGFQPTALEMLHHAADATERPVVGGLCFAQRDLANDGRNGYRWTPKPTLFDMVDVDGEIRFVIHTHYPVNNLVKCDATGGAFLLIHRGVFETIGEHWWSRFPENAGSLMAEDLSFFVRCRAAGIPLHVHTGVKTNHLKHAWVCETDFWAQFDPPPATERVDVIVPVLHRPQNIRPFMQSLTASTGLATAWFVCERDDHVEQDEVLAYGGRVLKCDGTFAEKVNYAYSKVAPKAPWVFLAGDDVQFRPGWLDHAQFVASAYQAKVVGTNDLGNAAVTRGDHATHMLIARDYVDQVGASWDGPGVVCHGYRHWYVDNEIVVAARQRGVWQMAIGSIVEHMHPLWGKGIDDEVYELGKSEAQADAAEFERRLTRYGAAT